MSDSEDDEDHCVPVRPYSDEGSVARRPMPAQPAERRTRVVQPRPPPQRRVVDRSQLVREETVSSVLQAARRSQEAEGARAGLAPALVPERYRGMSMSKFGVQSHDSRAAAASSSKAGGAPALPRKAKEWKEGKSTELMDLAFIDTRRSAGGRKFYTPISLPFVDMDADGGSDGEAGGTTGAKKSRPTMKLVDEANTNAARELFLSPEGELQEDHLLLLQLPAVLPELADPSDEVQREGEDARSAGAGATIMRYPDGKVGKLKIHKSGKVRMEIGGVPFCVDQGTATFFHQELACVCPLAQEMVSLGSIESRVVLTPDLDKMFADMELEAATKEAKAAEAKPAASGDAA